MSLLTLLRNQAATQTVVLDRLESTAQVFLPAVTLAGGTQTITLDRLESTAQVFLPTVVQAGGAQTITLNLLASTAQVFFPTIQLEGAVTDTSDALAQSKRRSKEEEEIAAQYLKSKQKQKQRKRKNEVKWKNLLLRKINGAEARLQDGDVPESLVEELTEAVLREEGPITAKPGTDFERLAEEYRREVKAEIASIVQARAEELQARVRAEEQKRQALIEAARVEALRLEAIRVEEERIAAIRAEEERRLKVKHRKWKAFLILATLDND